LRILKLSDVYFPRVNGVSTSIQTFRQSLYELGHETVLLAPDYGEPGQREEAGVRRVAARRVPLDPEDRMMQYRRLLGQARDTLRGGGYDVVHVHTPFLAHYAGVRLRREFGVPVVETYHTYFEEYLHHYVPFLPGGVLRLLARRFAVSQCRAVDALVVPTHAMLEVLRRYGVAARTETQGLVLLEAMALGVPVVSTAVLGTTEVLRDAEGAIVVREEESEFAAAVLGLLDDPELQTTLRAGGARTAARWSATSLAGRMAELYRDVAGGAAEALGEPVR